jgi:ATP-binding cassette subfamily C (CFTR/MRP) protein 1
MMVAFMVLGATSSLSAASVFSAMAYFNLLQFALIDVPGSVNMLISGATAAKRMEKFLAAPEIGASDPDRLLQADADGLALAIDSATFRWETLSAPSESFQTNDTTKSIGSTATADQKNDEHKSDLVAATAPDSASVVPVDVLSDVNLRVPRGSLTIIVGAVGSGKSTLLSGILGEAQRVTGTVMLSGRVGYAPQIPWIQNASLRDNILFGKPYDAERYKKVIHVCALSRDLEVLTDGDLTQIGEKGINLSGGQKQRINIARAVYSDPEIFLLDDPLSAVDAHVAKHLFDECFNGVLQGKTRVLVTHQLHYTSSPQVNSIVVLKNGTVVEQGSYVDLMGTKGELYRLVEEFSKAQDEVDSDVEEADTSAATTAEEAVNNDQAPVSVPLLRQRSHSDSTHNSHQKKKLVTVSEKDHVKAGLGGKDKEVTKLVDDEERAIGSVKGEIYTYFLNAAGSWVIPTAILSMLIITQGLTNFINFWLSFWVSDSFKQSTNWYLGIYAALGVSLTFLNGFSAAIVAYGGVQCSNNIHTAAFTRLLRAPMSFFDKTPLGRIINRFRYEAFQIVCIYAFVNLQIKLVCFEVIVVPLFVSQW